MLGNEEAKRCRGGVPRLLHTLLEENGVVAANNYASYRDCASSYGSAKL
jgi:hypothetical protein